MVAKVLVEHKQDDAQAIQILDALLKRYPDHAMMPQVKGISPIGIFDYRLRDCMLIIPLEKSIDWKRPPLVTLLLILTCTCTAILFGVQGYENKKNTDQFDFYFTSALPQLELPPYAAMLDDEGGALIPSLYRNCWIRIIGN